MVWAAVLALLTLWLLVLLSGAFSGFVHLLLVAAAIVFVYGLRTR